MDWHKYFTYDATSGSLIWKKRPLGHFPDAATCSSWNSKHAGKGAGHPIRGRMLLCVDYKRVLAMKAIWEFHHGVVPDNWKVSPRNKNMMDTRIENLFLCPYRQHVMRRTRTKPPMSGVRGVYPSGDGWMSLIKTSSGVVVRLGRRPTKGEAAVDYAKASLRYHGKFSVFYRKQAVANAAN